MCQAGLETQYINIAIIHIIIFSIIIIIIITVIRTINTLITEATQAITLLRERRAALISAAVTGKIDVRSLTPTKQEAA